MEKVSLVFIFLKPGKLNIPPLKKYLSIHSKKILEIGDLISVFIPFMGRRLGISLVEIMGKDTPKIQIAPVLQN